VNINKLKPYRYLKTIPKGLETPINREEKTQGGFREQGGFTKMFSIWFY